MYEHDRDGECGYQRNEPCASRRPRVGSSKGRRPAHRSPVATERVEEPVNRGQERLRRCGQEGLEMASAGQALEMEDRSGRVEGDWRCLEWAHEFEANGSHAKEDKQEWDRRERW